MNELRLIAHTGLDGWTHAKSLSRSDSQSGVCIELCRHVGFASVIAHRNRKEDVAFAMRQHFQLDLPPTGRCVQNRGVCLIGSGFNHWTAVSESLSDDQFADELSTRLFGLAAIADLSDGLETLRVHGGRVKDVLAKGIQIDLHPRVFTVGHAAATVLGHFAIQIWQVDHRPTFMLAVARSFAPNLWHWLLQSSTQFGFHISQAECVSRLCAKHLHLTDAARVADPQ